MHGSEHDFSTSCCVAMSMAFQAVDAWLGAWFFDLWLYGYEHDFLTCTCRAISITFDLSTQSYEHEFSTCRCVAMSMTFWPLDIWPWSCMTFWPLCVDVCGLQTCNVIPTSKAFSLTVAQFSAWIGVSTS